MPLLGSFLVLLAIVGSLFVLMRRRRLQSSYNRKGLPEYRKYCPRLDTPDHKEGRLPKTQQAYTVCLKKDSHIKINNETKASPPDSRDLDFMFPSNNDLDLISANAFDPALTSPVNNDIGTKTSESTFTGIILMPPQYDDTGSTGTSDWAPHPPSYSQNGYVNLPNMSTKLTDMTVK